MVNDGVVNDGSGARPSGMWIAGNVDSAHTVYPAAEGIQPSASSHAGEVIVVQSPNSCTFSEEPIVSPEPVNAVAEDNMNVDDAVAWDGSQSTVHFSLITAHIDDGDDDSDAFDSGFEIVAEVDFWHLSPGKIHNLNDDGTADVVDEYNKHHTIPFKDLRTAELKQTRVAESVQHYATPSAAAAVGSTSQPAEAEIVDTAAAPVTLAPPPPPKPAPFSFRRSVSKTLSANYSQARICGWSGCSKPIPSHNTVRTCVGCSAPFYAVHWKRHLPCGDKPFLYLDGDDRLELRKTFGVPKRSTPSRSRAIRWVSSILLLHHLRLWHLHRRRLRQGPRW